MYANTSEPNITAVSTVRTCSSRLVVSTFSSIMTVIRQFCFWIAPSDVVSLILVRKANVVEGGPHLLRHYHHQLNLTTLVADSVTVM